MSGRTVLIVDDDAALCTVMEALLTGADYQAEVAHTCREAEECLRRQAPHAALIDLRLPDCEGTELIGTIREVCPECVSIVMTAHADLDSAIAALEAGAHHYVRKPIQSDNLMPLLERACELVELRQEKRRAEEELARRSREWKNAYFALVEAAHDGVAIIQDEKLVFANRAARDMVQESDLPVEGLHYREFLAPEEVDASLHRYRKLLDTGGEGYTRQTRGLRRDGEKVDLEYSVTRIQYQGRPAVMVIIRDVSSRRRTQQILRQAKEVAEAASRAKSEFLTNMGHELRTPLSGMIGMAELLLGTTLDERQLQYARTIMRSGKALLAIINDLLEFSHLEAGRLAITPVPFDLREAVEDVVQIVEPRAQLKGLDLRIDCPPEVPRLLVGDAGRIRQILTNLLDNAVKFTERGGVDVRVDRLQETAGRVELRVAIEDTGTGIPSQDQEFIFEKFTQRDTSASRLHGGTGLGLAISKELVELMGGTMGVENRPGGGSCFWFRMELPRQPVAGRGRRTGTRNEAAASGAGARVLVVEDNDVNQEVAATILRKLGCEVEVASDGRQAVEQVGRDTFDLVFMDCSMPGMDGFEATAAIRQQEARSDRRVAIVAMTAHSLDEDRERCLQAGMDDYIAKPATMADFRGVLDRFRTGHDGEQESS